MHKYLFIVVLVLTFVFPFASVEAVGNLNNAGDFLNPARTAAGYSEGDIGNITGQIINTALQLVGIIFLALTVYAGYLWMTAQGEESQIEKAKKIITGAVIGLVITMSAYAITTLVTSRFSSGQQEINADAGAAPRLKPNGSRCQNGAECQSGVCGGNRQAEVCL